MKTASIHNNTVLSGSLDPSKLGLVIHYKMIKHNYQRNSVKLQDTHDLDGNLFHTLAVMHCASKLKLWLGGPQPALN